MDTLLQTVEIFLRKNHVSFDKVALEAELTSHPTYPSLDSIVETLTLLDIESLCVDLTLEELIPNGTPALVHLTGEIDQFGIVESITKDTIKVNCPFLSKTIKYTHTDFQQSWQGTTLYIVENEEQPLSVADRCKQYFYLYKSEALWAGILLLLIGLLTLPNHPHTPFFYYLLGIKMIGLFISIGLIKHELHEETKALKKICSIGKSFNCSAVLESKASKLFGWIPLSDMGGAYFSGGIILLLTGMMNDMYLAPIISSLAILSYLSIFYIGYSLYYQYFVIKKWCPLCLLTLLMLGLEIIGSVYFYKEVEVSFKALFFICVLFGILWIIWDTIHLRWESYKKLADVKAQYLKMLKDEELYHLIESKERKIEIDTLPVSSYVSACKTASTQIVAVISLSCSPCARACQILLSLKKKYQEKLDVRFCFIPNTADPENIMNKVTAYFYALYIKKGFNEVAKALEIWMTNTNFEHLKVACPVEFDEEEVQSLFRRQIEWLEEQSIHATPTLIVNGHLLSKWHSMEYLPYIVR